jgi:methylphosphotriester-DNA--protein-cysteine methyltransferase
LGGYWSEKKYGRPDYCPSATRVHKKRIAETGVSPNLVYFDSVEAAVLAGFTPCGNCYLKGAEGPIRWQEYLLACETLGVEPGQPPKRLRK